jgi:CheY-like chemotaxis protein
MAFLRREGAFRDAARPDLILLDLNLPGKDGREVLAEIKADPGLRQIPVVVLTASAEEQDVLRSYNLRANSYITKSADPVQFARMVQAVTNYWLAVSTLPAAANKVLPPFMGGQD